MTTYDSDSRTALSIERQPTIRNRSSSQYVSNNFEYAFTDSFVLNKDIFDVVKVNSG